MKKSLIFAALLASSLSFLEAKDPFLMSQEAPSKIFVNNRILAQVKGKAISVVDVMKKMDMLFYKQYPEYTSSAAARFQFYQAQWQGTLQQLIDKQLVLADAEENKLPVSQGDVRQEMEAMFGPNIIINLDKIGLTFDEALKMVEDDIILQRMIHIRANSKAMKRITPQVVKSAYEEFAKTHHRPEQWNYQVFTIRNSDSDAGLEAANFAYAYLSDNGEIANLKEKIEQNPDFKESKLSISETFSHAEKDLNPEYKKTLDTMTAGTFSKPVVTKTRKDREKVVRIFYLKEHTQEGPIPFSEIANKIREELLNIAMAEETDAYLKKLHEHYHVDESIFTKMSSDDFAPFILK